MLYGGEVFSNLADVIERATSMGNYSIDVEGGFGFVPPLEVVRILSSGDFQDVDSMQRITKFCIRGKRTTIFYNGKQVGSPFIMNGMEDDWGAFDVFNSNPVALQFLMTVCMADMLKKSVPPRVDTLAAPAAGN